MKRWEIRDKSKFVSLMSVSRLKLEDKSDMQWNFMTSYESEEDSVGTLLRTRKEQTGSHANKNRELRLMEKKANIAKSLRCAQSNPTVSFFEPDM
jgi:hypothetical protein